MLVLEAANRLTESQRSGTTLQPIYNGLGDRVGQTSNGDITTFALDLAAGLPEVIYTSDDIRYLHLPGVIISQNDIGETNFLLSDGLGSIRQVVDSAETVVISHEFDPYGNPVQTGGAPYGYTGEWWESKVGLLHLRARWYDPGTGRFIVPDPSGQEQNLYQYAASNPINKVDRTGLLSGSPYEAMIQVHYRDNFAVGEARFEFPIPGGSKTDLTLDSSGIPRLTGMPNLNTGFADLVDVLQPGGLGLAYEIKHERDTLKGIADINWYVTVYNDPYTPKRPREPSELVHGINYPMTWQVIGINPVSKGSQFVLARRSHAGVIVWKGARMDNPDIPFPLPRYIYEYDQETNTVNRRPSPPLAPAPAPAPLICPVEPEPINHIGFLIGAGGYLLWNLKGCIFGPWGCVVDLATPGL